MEDIVFSDEKLCIIDDDFIKSKKKIDNSKFIVYDCTKGNKNLLAYVKQGKINLVYGCEFHKNKDFGHQVNSGIDHVILKEMATRGVKYGFCVSLIKKSLNSYDFKRILPRLGQNLVLLRKTKCEFLVFSGDSLISIGERKSFLKNLFG